MWASCVSAVNRKARARRVAVALGALSMLLAAPGGVARGEVAEPAPSLPGGHVYGGLGLHGVGPTSPGLAVSLELALEIGRGLLAGEVLVGKDFRTGGNAVLLLGGSAGAVLLDSDDAPYLLVGLAAMGRGHGEPERFLGATVPSLEGGWIFGRSRRFGQLWLGARLMVPFGHPTQSTDRPLADLPFALLSARLLL